MHTDDQEMSTFTVSAKEWKELKEQLSRLQAAQQSAPQAAAHGAAAHSPAITTLPQAQWKAHCKVMRGRYTWHVDGVAPFMYNLKDGEQHGQAHALFSAAGLTLPDVAVLATAELPLFSGKKDDYAEWEHSVVSKLKSVEADEYLLLSHFDVINRLAQLYDQPTKLPVKTGGCKKAADDDAAKQELRASHIMGAIAIFNSKIISTISLALTKALSKEKVVRTVYELHTNSRTLSDASINVDDAQQIASIASSSGFTSTDMHMLWSKLRDNYAVATEDRIDSLKREFASIAYPLPISTDNANRFIRMIEDVAGKLKLVMTATQYSIFEQGVLHDHYHHRLPVDLEKQLRLHKQIRKASGDKKEISIEELKTWIVTESGSISTLHAKRQEQSEAVNAMQHQYDSDESSTPAPPSGKQQAKEKRKNRAKDDKKEEGEPKPYFCQVCFDRARRDRLQPPTSYDHNTPGGKGRTHIACCFCGAHTGAARFSRCKSCNDSLRRNTFDSENRTAPPNIGTKPPKTKRVHTTEHSDEGATSSEGEESSTTSSFTNSTNKQSTSSYPSARKQKRAREYEINLAATWESKDSNNYRLSAVRQGYDTDGNAFNLHRRAQLDSGAAACLTGNRSLLFDIKPVPAGSVRFKAVDHAKTMKIMTPTERGYMWLTKELTVRPVYYVPGINATIISQHVLESGCKATNSKFIIDCATENVQKVRHRRDSEDERKRYGPTVLTIRKDKSSHLWFFQLPVVDEDADTETLSDGTTMLDRWFGEPAEQERQIANERKLKQQQQNSKIPKKNAAPTCSKQSSPSAPSASSSASANAVTTHNKFDALSDNKDDEQE